MCKGLPRIFRALLLLGLTGSLVVALAVPAFARSSAADDRRSEASQLGFGGLSDAVRGTLKLVLQLVGVGGAAQDAAGQPPPEPGSPLGESRERHERTQRKLREADARQRTIQQRMDEKGPMAALSMQGLVEYGEAGAALEEARTEEQDARNQRIKAIKDELARLRGTADTPPGQITELEEELEGLGAEDKPEESGAEQPAPATENDPPATEQQPDQDAGKALLGDALANSEDPVDRPLEVPFRDTGLDYDRPVAIPDKQPDTKDDRFVVVGGTVGPVHLGDGTGTGDETTEWFSGSLEDLIKGDTRRGLPEGTGVLPGGCEAKVAAGVPCPGGQTGPSGDIGTWPPAGLTGQPGGCDLEGVNALSNCGLIDTPTVQIFNPVPELPVPASQGCGVPGVMAICTLPGADLGGTRTTTTDPKLELAPYGSTGDPFGLDLFQAPAQPGSSADLAG